MKSRPTALRIEESEPSTSTLPTTDRTEYDTPYAPEEIARLFSDLLNNLPPTIEMDTNIDSPSTTNKINSSTITRKAIQTALTEIQKDPEQNTINATNFCVFLQDYITLKNKSAMSMSQMFLPSEKNTEIAKQLIHLITRNTITITCDDLVGVMNSTQPLQGRTGLLEDIIRTFHSIKEFDVLKNAASERCMQNKETGLYKLKAGYEAKSTIQIGFDSPIPTSNARMSFRG